MENKKRANKASRWKMYPMSVLFWPPFPGCGVLDSQFAAPLSLLHTLVGRAPRGWGVGDAPSISQEVFPLLWPMQVAHLPTPTASELSSLSLPPFHSVPNHREGVNDCYNFVCLFFQVISRLSNKSTVSQVWLFAKEQNIYLKFVGFPTNLSPPWGCSVFIFDFP